MMRIVAIVTVAAMLATTLTEVSSQTVPYYIGPRALYSSPPTNGHRGVPPLMRDAVQKMTIGSRLLAIDPRVIGGEPAPTGAFPWTASIGVRGVAQQDGHFCGGAFIAPQWVLTAAHCVTSEVAEKIQVLGGSNALTRDDGVHFVDQVIVHEQYNTEASDYDVALLHVSKPYGGSVISPIATADATRLMESGGLAVVAGWGLTAESGNVSPMLRRVTVQFVSNKVCNGLASYSGAITDRMICAGFPEGGKDSCQGDSGGPLMVADTNRSYVLAGVVSFGEGCGRPNKFGVYTNVAIMLPWILSHIGGRPGVATPSPAQPQAMQTTPLAATVPMSAAPARSLMPSPPTNPAAPRLRGGVASNSRAQVPAVKKMKKKLEYKGPARKPVRRVVVQ